MIGMSTRHRAVLIDVSATGARIRAEDPPKRGSEVILQAKNLDVFGRIVWKSGELCGIRFDREIEPFQVELMRREGAEAAAMRMTAAQKGGADDWFAGLAR